MKNHEPISVLMDLMSEKIKLLDDYSAGLCAMLRDLKADFTDSLDQYASKHDAIIERLVLLDCNITNIVDTLETHQAETVRLILRNEIKADNCPSFDRELFSIADRLYLQTKKSADLNRQCSEQLKISMALTKDHMIKSNNSNNVYNYYLSLKQSNTGIMLDVKE